MADNKNEQIIKALTAWGCDIAGAMPRFLNNKDFYCTLLSSVPEETAFIDLGQALHRNDVKTAFEKAHELKGVLANMGLTPMFELACVIVEPLRAGKTDGVVDNYKKLMEMREQLKTILRG